MERKRRYYEINVAEKNGKEYEKILIQVNEDKTLYIIKPTGSKIDLNGVAKEPTLREYVECKNNFPNHSNVTCLNLESRIENMKE